MSWDHYLPARYRSMCRVIPDETQDAYARFVVTTIPHPIHAAEVVKAARGTAYIATGGTAYIVRTLSLPLQRSLPPQPLGMALHAASTWAGRLYGQQWRTRFSGQQRIMIGQQGCPYLSAAGLCGASIEPGTIWCSGHPMGRKAA